MKSIAPILNEQSSRALYLQLYDHIKHEVITGGICADEKLPSLRFLAKNLNLSLTTIDLAYQQLQVEGYIRSKPQSGYYVNNILPPQASAPVTEPDPAFKSYRSSEMDLSYLDESAFDFIKWKKCLNKIFNDLPQSLLTEGDPQGEQALRQEIAKYVYQSRGVRCTPGQVVIGAGTQQITGLLCSLLKNINIKKISFEDPGYIRVRKTFSDREFDIHYAGVKEDGIDINSLPFTPGAVYVTPSNQFPTGALMPVGRRYELLKWARKHNSIIIEDDYDSELRYFGRPIPSLQGLDQNQLVVYLGSFSSTLFPAIKISYMILPERIASLFAPMRESYSQTCSKTEQLALALYMQKGFYQIHIKKLRKLYSQKLTAALQAISLHLGDKLSVLQHTSGLHLLLTPKHLDFPHIYELCEKAKQNGLLLLPVNELTAPGDDQTSLYSNALIFYYTRIPLPQIEEAILTMASLICSYSDPDRSF